MDKTGMLMLARTPNTSDGRDTIIINEMDGTIIVNEIEIVIRKSRGKHVRVGIRAPEKYRIIRGELK